MPLTGVRESSFVVLGLGTFGGQTARALYKGGAIVLAIDQDEKLVDEISNSVTVSVRADATNEEALRAIGAFDMDCAVVAIRRRFDTTVLATHMLARNGLKKVLVQVDSELEADAIRAVGATGVIFPERDMADQVARRLLTPSLADQIPLGENVAIIDVLCPSSFIGKTLQELALRQKYHITVVALKAPGKGGHYSFEIAPGPDVPLQADHHLVLLGDRKRLYNFKRELNIESTAG